MMDDYPMTDVMAQSLGSGSSGNALVLSSGGRAVIVDHGISLRRVKAGLTTLGLVLDDVDAILITHEHHDHVNGLQRGLTQTDCPIVTMAATLPHLAGARGRAILAEAGRPLDIAGWEITALPVTHDAAAPCGYSIAVGGVRWTVLTDLGEPCAAATELLSISDLLVVEANHDAEMLRRGPYPAHLKRRIASGRGHLSNEQTGAWLSRALSGSSVPRTVWLAHLSKTNNRSVAAVTTVARAAAVAGVDLRPIALPRGEVGPTWRPDDDPPAVVLLAPTQLSLSFPTS